jgi:hypothetical protein
MNDEKDTSGFFKLSDAGTLLHAPNRVFVQATKETPAIDLIREKKDGYTYGEKETDGWQFFDSEADACDAFGIAPPPAEMSADVKVAYETLTRALEKEGKTVDDVLSASVKMADSPAVKLARGEQ